jgi:hypothetical protein
MSDTETTGTPTDPLASIAESLAAIRSVLEAGHEASEKIRAESRAAMAAQAERAAQQAATRTSAAPRPTLDPFPFVSLPPGTTARDLPAGGRLFVLADGAFVRVNERGVIAAVTPEGNVQPLQPARGGRVSLPDGRELALRPEALRVTHEAAGIEGLPDAIEPFLAAPNRYTVTFPSGTRLDVLHAERLVTLTNSIGTTVVIGYPRIDAIGESVSVRSGPGGIKAFSASESGHQGLIEADGTIHLALASGEDLVIRFPELLDPDDGVDEPGELCPGCQA